MNLFLSLSFRVIFVCFYIFKSFCAKICRLTLVLYILYNLFNINFIPFEMECDLNYAESHKIASFFSQMKDKKKKKGFLLPFRFVFRLIN